jgi:hypothetical protein
VWREIWGASLAFDTVWGGTVGMGLGAWLGAVPIPLDWCGSPFPCLFLFIVSFGFPQY